MSQFTQKKLTAKALEKAIKASIKKEVSARGINVTTRQGNKEFIFFFLFVVEVFLVHLRFLH